MIVGFSRYGQGGGRGPVDYVMDEKRLGREKSPPVVLRGSSDATRDLIDSLDFKHKYTSGVLSFAPGEEITPEMEQDCMNRFEALAFAGLEPDQYNVLWVRHSHAGHHELHFVTPRVELSTGKSLNIRPPGSAAKQAFDDFRSEVNARYGLADPDDPHRAREIAQPDHLLKIAAEAIRRGEKPQDDMRVLIDAVLSQRAVQGVIRHRRDVIEQVADLGLEVTREGKNYITISDPESGQRWRMKGGLYEREFDATRAIEAATPRGKQNYSGADQEAARRYAKRVERHITARTEYHQSRYQKPKSNHRLDYVQKPDIVASVDRLESLSQFLRRELGNDALLQQSDPRIAAECSDIRTERRQDSVQPMRETEAVLRPDRRKRTSLSGWLPNSEGVLNDRAGNAFIERFKEYGATIQRTTQSIRASASRFAEHVRTYCGRQRHAVRASQLLEQSSDQIDLAAPAVRGMLQAEQAIRRQQVEREQREQLALKNKSKPSRSYGPSM
ncbi:relaxase/mobilization nuclease domain-containing protein [Xenorhabdus stockiae]|uniref:relaxase/mobilization nuclease domain-containing protein n=1 Tax=Xenorhabdus stockiae TaxID=351614 RepID=UPI004062D947